MTEPGARKVLGVMAWFRVQCSGFGFRFSGFAGRAFRLNAPRQVMRTLFPVWGFGLGCWDWGFRIRVSGFHYLVGHDAQVMRTFFGDFRIRVYNGDGGEGVEGGS